MKKGLYLAALLAAVGILSRLPHPARDIADLKPVRAVYLYIDGRGISIETDTGDSGSGRDLGEAADDLRAKADGEIFLDTAQFLLLDPRVPVDPGAEKLGGTVPADGPGADHLARCRGGFPASGKRRLLALGQ